MYRVSFLGLTILDTEERTAAAAEAKATAARRGHSVVVTVLNAGANPYQLVYLPDGSMIPAFYDGDEDLYRGNRQLLQTRIDELRRRADLLIDHTIRVSAQLPCNLETPCRDCRCRGLCDAWTRALHKKSNLEGEIRQLYRMRRSLLASRKAVQS